MQQARPLLKLLDLLHYSLRYYYSKGVVTNFKRAYYSASTKHGNLPVYVQVFHKSGKLLNCAAGCHFGCFAKHYYSMLVTYPYIGYSNYLYCNQEGSTISLVANSVVFPYWDRNYFSYYSVGVCFGSGSCLMILRIHLNPQVSILNYFMSVLVNPQSLIVTIRLMQQLCKLKQSREDCSYW